MEEAGPPGAPRCIMAEGDVGKVEIIDSRVSIRAPVHRGRIYMHYEAYSVHHSCNSYILICLRIFYSSKEVGTHHVGHTR